MQLCVCNLSLVFQLGDPFIRLVGLGLTVVAVMTCCGLCGNLCPMRRLNCGIVLLNLMDFAVNTGGKGVTDLADGFIGFKL